eukprot:730201-Rhodomonas_salina.2
MPVPDRAGQRPPWLAAARTPGSTIPAFSTAHLRAHRHIEAYAMAVPDIVQDLHRKIATYAIAVPDIA